MMYTDNKLQINDTEVNLPATITEAVEFEDTVVVQLDTLGKADQLGSEVYRRNIWCIEDDGTVRWKIETADRIDGQIKPYTNVWTEDDVLRAYNWNGIAYEIDPSDGSHRDSQVMK